MQNVEPFWDKVSMKAIFDLIVIGTGTAGSSVAQRCSAAGWRVAIVDNRPCALRGCEPKKALWTVVEAYDPRAGRAMPVSRQRRSQD